MKTKLLVYVILLATSFGVNAQEQTLDDYIKEGLQGNQTLKQQGFQLQKALYALDEAKTLFMPSTNLVTQYSTAGGGRTINFPVGDLVNPIYSTLNKLTPANAQKFPEGAVPNVNEQLVPKNFYDVRVKTSYPLINAELKYNKAIKQEQVGLQQVEISIYKRELVKDIKTGYFNFLKAHEAVEIYRNALKLLRESERVNQSLINNGSANPTVLVRTRNEITKIEAEIEAATNTEKNARAYFNFLLNRDFNLPVKVDSVYKKNQTPELASGNREELEKIQRGIAVNKQILGLNSAYKTPKLGVGLDLGSQGFVDKIATENFFYLIGVSLELPLYTANRNKLKIKQAQMEIASLEAFYEQAKRQLELQVQVSENSLESAKTIHKSKQSQVETAQRYYRDTMKRYKEGQINFIELLDAQTQITQAQLQQSLAHYDVWIRLAELERAKAGSKI
jgi:outer membrane protein TolC